MTAVLNTLRDARELGAGFVVRRALGGSRARLRGGRTPLVLDAGAGIGVSSLWFRARYPDAAVVAVEPDPDPAGGAGLGAALITPRRSDRSGVRRG